MRAPLRRIGTQAGCAIAVTDDRAASRGVHGSSGCCYARGCRGHWVPRTRSALVVSDGTTGFHRSPSTARLRLRFHPLVSFAPLQSPPSRVRRRCLHRQRLPWGSRSLFATSPTGVRAPEPPSSRVPFRPRRFSRPRRLSPPTGLRVCFTPLPRPGFALQGFSLASSCADFHRRCSCPLAVGRRPADDVATAATNLRLDLRALFRLRIRCRRFSY